MDLKLLPIIELIDNFITENYPNIYIEKNNYFIGCKFNESNKYFIFFLSLIDNKITLSYRKNVNLKEVNRIPLTAIDSNVLKTTITNIIEYNKNNIKEPIIERNKRNYLTQDRLNSIRKIESKINKEEVIKRYSNINIEEIQLSNKLYKTLKRNNINTLSSLLLTKIEDLNNHELIGRTPLKELINIKLSLVYEGRTNLKNNESPIIKTCLKTNLDPNFYNITNNKYKELFNEKEYEQYLDFGLEIGNLTINILKQTNTKKHNEIFKKRMNIINTKRNTLKDLANNYNIPKERVKQIINRKTKNLKKYKCNYIELFNKIADKEILNYLIIGILYTYNNYFLECILDILDENIKNPIIRKINYLLKIPNIDMDISKKMYNLIKFPGEINPNAKEKYHSLIKERNVSPKNNVGVEELERLNSSVAYESFLEREILDRLNKCEFVSSIKTQSLVITYKHNEQIYHYYPDIQLLTNDNQLVIIEVKPLFHMIDRTSLIKYQALKKYCEKKGYGYAMIDEQYNSIESILKHEVDSNIAKSFIFYLKEKGKINYNEYCSFKETFLITLKDLAKIVIENCDSIEFNHSPFCIKYLDESEE